MTSYKAKRPINGKSPIWVIIDESGNVVNRNPSEVDRNYKYNVENMREYEITGKFCQVDGRSCKYH